MDVISSYQEIEPQGKPFKQAYVGLMLWFVGRAVQAASRVDPVVKKEFEDLPANFTFSLGVRPNGPRMIIGKDDNGRVNYLGTSTDRPIDVVLNIKNIEAAFLLFSFQESTSVSMSRDRIILDGEVPYGCAIVRVLDIVEVYLLPKLIAGLAVKRYPVWPWMRKYSGRVRVYFRALAGY